MTANATLHADFRNQPADGWDRPLLHGLLLGCFALLVHAPGADGWLRVREASGTDSRKFTISASCDQAFAHLRRAARGQTLAP